MSAFNVSMPTSSIFQIKYLRDALDKHIEMSRKKEALGEEEVSKTGSSAATEAELEEAQEQIVKLKSLLATKREQIATLRFLRMIFYFCWQKNNPFCPNKVCMKKKDHQIRGIYVKEV